ncbi:glycoside hydrolase family 88 protein [Cohnella sp.]|uniref:glycoside hydrolase family 88 protein n=1 Tax=Cohnella sp. TaxID=1883426 RepID=UPI003563814D
MWKSAIEDAVAKTTANGTKHGARFPHIRGKTEGHGYDWRDNTDWIEGFYAGMMWLSYEYGGDPLLRDIALEQMKDFRRRLDEDIALDHHDIGFLYSPSAMAAWIVEGNEDAKRLALDAADKLLRRWRPEGGYIQAWGKRGDEKNGGRIIIDCLMNIPLLYWATEQTGNPAYREIAIQHADKSRRYLVRGDDSSYHTFYFNPSDGVPIGGGTHQGFHDGSTWTRGQAWGIYGFALSFRYTGDSQYLETSRRLARYFAERLPEDDVVYWDFDVPMDEDTYRDSSASAIAACGMLELAGHLQEDDPDRTYFANVAERTMRSLVKNYSTMDDANAEGLIRHGSYYVRGDLGPDDYMIWGDYYYLEALMRLEEGVPGYWYERNK